MKNFGFELVRTASQSYVAIGAPIAAAVLEVRIGNAMPMRVETRGSSAPTDRPIHAPNDMPAAQTCAPGYRRFMKSRAALKSSFSPGPPVNSPVLAPAPRKLMRRTAQPMRLNALAA